MLKYFTLYTFTKILSITGRSNIKKISVKYFNSYPEEYLSYQSGNIHIQVKMNSRVKNISL